MDQENYKEALDEVSSVLRQNPNTGRPHPPGTIQNHMRKLVDASEIALGLQADTVSCRARSQSELARPDLERLRHRRGHRSRDLG